MFTTEILKKYSKLKLTLIRVSGLNGITSPHSVTADVDPYLGVVTTGGLELTENKINRVRYLKKGDVTPTDFVGDVIGKAIGDMEYICVHPSTPEGNVISRESHILNDGSEFTWNTHKLLVLCSGAICIDNRTFTEIQVINRESSSVTIKSISDNTIFALFDTKGK